MIGELHDTISCKYWIKFSDTLPIVFLPHLIELCLCSQFCCQFQIAAFSYLSFEQVLEFSCHTFDGVVLVLWPNLICCLASKKKASAFRMKWFWFNRWFLCCPFLKKYFHQKQRKYRNSHGDTNNDCHFEGRQMWIFCIQIKLLQW